jgi:hypothetical protein
VIERERERATFKKKKKKIGLLHEMMGCDAGQFRVSRALPPKRLQFKSFSPKRLQLFLIFTHFFYITSTMKEGFFLCYIYL